MNKKDKRTNAGNTQQTQPEPALEPATGSEEIVASMSERAANVIDLAPTRKGKSLIAMQKAERSDRISAKAQLLSETRQRFAEAADLYQQGGENEKEADTVAGKAAMNLYNGRRDNLFNADEVTAILGDIFGWKTKKDGSPSKTPLGVGERIRKRVVRCVNAHNFIATGDGGSFFDGVPEAPVANELDRLNNGDVSIFTAYNNFAEIKNDNRTKVNPAFDAVRIMKLVENLSDVNAPRAFATNPGLVAAYSALVDIIAAVDQKAAEWTEAA